MFIGVERETPQQMLERMVTTWGGVPRESTGVGAVDIARTTIYPVTSWYLKTLNVHTTEGQPFFDDDPTYGLIAEIEATYADGTRGRLEWNWWQYGEVRCPFVVHVGDGPPGMMNVVEIVAP